MKSKQQSKAALAAFNKILQAAGVLIEDFDFTPCQVSETLSDVLRQVDKRDPIVIPTYDDSKHSPNSSAQA
jgi:hypothetical protein